jgi:PAS domain S-box-containing protein
VTRPKGQPRFETGGAAYTIILSSTLVLILCAWTVFIERIVFRDRVTSASLVLDIAGVILLGVIGASAGARWARHRSTLLEDAARARELAQTSLAQLDDATRLMRAVVDTSPVATIAIDRDRNVTFWSRGAEAMLGWSTQEVLGRPMPQELGGDAPQAEAQPRRLQATDVVLGSRALWHTRNGDERVVEIYAAPLRRDGMIEGFAGQAFDITDREQARIQLERLADGIDQTVDSVVIADADGVIVYANAAFERQSGYALADLIGSHHGRVFGELFGPEVVESMNQVGRDREPWFGEVKEVRGGAPTTLVQLSLTPLRGASGAVDGTVALLRDVTYMRSIESDLALEAAVRGVLGGAVHLIAPDAGLHDAAKAVCDGLTSIAGIDFASVEVFFSPTDAALVAISASDSLPLSAGDHLSPSFSSRLYERANNGPWGEQWLSRPDDDEFGIALGQASLKAFAFAPIFHGDHLDGGVGIGTGDPAFALTLAERFPLLVDFGTAPTVLLAERLHEHRNEVALRTATAEMIEQRGFHTVFQPVVELASGKVVGYEALTRFESGQRPDLTFAAARSVGLGLELELATLDAAICKSRDLPAGLWLHINISPSLLTDRDSLSRSLAGADRLVVIEVTEHEPVADYAALREAVGSLGVEVRLAVDDAGAGIANFAHILEMNAHIVKLDVSLVRGIDTSLSRQALVVAMSHFSRAVGCQLVAEGVETDAEVAALREFGVEFGQGYWFGRPEPLPEALSAARHRGRQG